MEKRYFRTDGIRGRVDVEPITIPFARKIGWVIGTVLQETNDSPTILIGKDTRLSSHPLESALASGLLASGSHIQCMGVVPTPALAYLVNVTQAQAGIMITASHNPHSDNGYKFFSTQGKKFHSELESVIENKLHQTDPFIPIKRPDTLQYNETLIQHYLTFCQNIIPSQFSLHGKKIILDCAHGATYQIAPYLFQLLGAEIIVIGNQPNGVNINLNHGSTHPATLQRHVLQEKADIGMAWDGDGDRIIMVDHMGALYNGDDLLFILAKSKCTPPKSQQSSVVGTIMTNSGLERALNDIGINLIRTLVGDQHIYNALEKTNGTLGAEPSGHIICKHLTPTADGIVAALQVLFALEGASLQEACADFKKWPHYLTHVPTECPQFLLEDVTVQSMVRETEKQLVALEGRLVIRASGTEPCIRIMVEGAVLSEIQTIAETLAKRIGYRSQYVLTQRKERVVNT